LNSCVARISLYHFQVGGICIVPINDSLVKLTRLRDDKIDRKALLPVSFATLVHPRASEIPKTVILRRTKLVYVQLVIQILVHLLRISGVLFS